MTKHKSGIEKMLEWCLSELDAGRNYKLPGLTGKVRDLVAEEKAHSKIDRPCICENMYCDGNCHQVCSECNPEKKPCPIKAQENGLVDEILQLMSSKRPLSSEARFNYFWIELGAILSRHTAKDGGGR